MVTVHCTITRAGHSDRGSFSLIGCMRTSCHSDRYVVPCYFPVILCFSGGNVGLNPDNSGDVPLFWSTPMVLELSLRFFRVVYLEPVFNLWRWISLLNNIHTPVVCSNTSRNGRLDPILPCPALVIPIIILVVWRLLQGCLVCNVIYLSSLLYQRSHSKTSSENLLLYYLPLWNIH